MRLAIATHTGLYLAEYDGTSFAAGQIGIGYYYGLGVYDGFILAGRRIHPYSKESPTAFETWNADGLCLGTPNIDGNRVIDVHQVTSTPRGHYICNAHHNSIGFVSRDFTHSRDIHFNCDEPLNNLFNSVYYDGDYLWAVQHNRGVRQSEVIQIKHHEDDTVVLCAQYRLNAKGVHNVFLYNDWLYFNASDSGAIRGVYLPDYNTDDWERKGRIACKHITVREGYHTKGLATDLPTNRLFIGVSEQGNMDVRFNSASSIAVHELDSLEFVHAFHITDKYGNEVGNINEIRILD